MGVWIQITPGSKEPIYAQIVSRIGRAIAVGDLAPGDRLPAVRVLAAELTVNPNTVARAYSVLEEQGLVSTRTGSGTYITEPAVRRRDAARLDILSERMDSIIAEAVNLGLSGRETADVFKERIERFARMKGEAANE